MPCVIQLTVYIKIHEYVCFNVKNKHVKWKIWYMKWLDLNKILYDLRYTCYRNSGKMKTKGKLLNKCNNYFQRQSNYLGSMLWTQRHLTVQISVNFMFNEISIRSSIKLVHSDIGWMTHLQFTQSFSTTILILSSSPKNQINKWLLSIRYCIKLLKLTNVHLKKKNVMNIIMYQRYNTIILNTNHTSILQHVHKSLNNNMYDLARNAFYIN